MKYKNLILGFFIIIAFAMIIAPLLATPMSYAQPSSPQQQQSQQASQQASQSSGPLVGFSMRGYQTNMPQERDTIRAMPPNYYENSFAAFSQNHLDFVRYLIIWEAYERDPVAFMNELNALLPLQILPRFGNNQP